MKNGTMDKYKNKSIMRIATSDCRVCGKKMKIAFAIINGGLYTPFDFSNEHVKFATDNGVMIKMQFSKTMGQSYLANTCEHCGNFVGDFFIHEYIDEPDSVELEML